MHKSGKWEACCGCALTRSFRYLPTSGCSASRHSSSPRSSSSGSWHDAPATRRRWSRRRRTGRRSEKRSPEKSKSRIRAQGSVARHNNFSKTRQSINSSNLKSKGSSDLKILMFVSMKANTYNERVDLCFLNLALTHYSGYSFKPCDVATLRLKLEIRQCQGKCRKTKRLRWA